jgi:hypothetical protein
MPQEKLESLERELRGSYSENLELKLDSKSPTFSEIMSMNKTASSNIKRILRLN